MILAPVLKQRYFDSNGNPLAGGKLYSYAAGTSTPQATYTDQGGLTANANPVILDANGYASVWLDPDLVYKFTLTDSNDVTIFTQDNVLGTEAEEELTTVTRSQMSDGAVAQLNLDGPDDLSAANYVATDDNDVVIVSADDCDNVGIVTLPDANGVLGRQITVIRDSNDEDTNKAIHVKSGQDNYPIIRPGQARTLLATGDTSGLKKWKPLNDPFGDPALYRMFNHLMLSTWTSRTVTANAWTGICWSPELHMYAAVSSDGTNRVATSYDGVTWTERTAAAANQWQAVIWAAELSLFVAVANSGTGNRVMTSPDGINWTSRSSAADNNWVALCWSPEETLLVAVANSGTGNRVMTSPDGINWTSRSSAADSSWSGVAWSAEEEIFVAVAGDTSNQIMSSPDGTTWTLRSAGGLYRFGQVIWVKELSKFIATGWFGADYATSEDGVTWTASSDAPGLLGTCICWSPELKLLIAGAGGDDFHTSPDGSTWTAHTNALGTDNEMDKVCWSPALRQFGVVGNSRIITSI